MIPGAKVRELARHARSFCLGGCRERAHDGTRLQRCESAVAGLIWARSRGIIPPRRTTLRPVLERSNEKKRGAPHGPEWVLINLFRADSYMSIDATPTHPPARPARPADGPTGQPHPHRHDTRLTRRQNLHLAYKRTPSGVTQSISLAVPHCIQHAHIRYSAHTQFPSCQRLNGAKTHGALGLW